MVVQYAGKDVASDRACSKFTSIVAQEAGKDIASGSYVVLKVQRLFKSTGGALQAALASDATAPADDTAVWAAVQVRTPPAKLHAI